MPNAELCINLTEPLQKRLAESRMLRAVQLSGDNNEIRMAWYGVAIDVGV